MKAAPGSALWLLRHELRLSWMGAAINRAGQRRPSIASLLVWLLGWITLHGVAWALLGGKRPLDMSDPRLGIAAGALLLVCSTFMLSNALRASVMALFERGDLDLLLSSPLPTRSIFTVRLAGVALSSATLFLYIFTPLANVALVLGQPRWLAIYLVLGAVATLAACASMLLTLALVRLLGARRTRVLAQIVAALAGAMLFLLSQAYNLVSHSRDPNAGARAMRWLVEGGLFGPDSFVWLPGRAALGEALPLLLMLALAGGAFALTVARTHRFFAHGLQQAAGLARTPARAHGPLRMRVRRSLFDAVVIKEWRLIARDPQLISQVLLQLIYLVPMFVIVLRGGDTPAAAVGAGMTVLCASLASSLAWIVISGEEAPDLLLSSPVALRTVQLAKLAASAMPPLLLAALPLGWMVLRMPVDGLLVCFTLTASVLSGALIVLWVGRPAPRSDFKMRGKENLLCTLCEGANGLSWAGLSWLLVTLAARPASGALALGAMLVLALALGALLLAWLLRRRPA